MGRVFRLMLCGLASVAGDSEALTKPVKAMPEMVGANNTVTLEDGQMTSLGDLLDANEKSGVDTKESVLLYYSRSRISRQCQSDSYDTFYKATYSTTGSIDKAAKFCRASRRPGSAARCLQDSYATIYKATYSASGSIAKAATFCTAARWPIDAARCLQDSYATIYKATYSPSGSIAKAATFCTAARRPRSAAQCLSGSYAIFYKATYSPSGSIEKAGRFCATSRERNPSSCLKEEYDWFYKKSYSTTGSIAKAAAACSGSSWLSSFMPSQMYVGFSGFFAGVAVVGLATGLQRRSQAVLEEPLMA